MIKIGYQGIEGSNAQQAAKDLVEKLNLKDVEYVPLVDSPHVINAMKRGQIDYGVCAVYNSAAGMVLETFFATNGVELLIRGETTMTIHHCLFKKNPDIPDEHIKYVASHVLALKQCENHLKYEYPQLRKIEVEDTGTAARDLAEGILSDDHAILCRKNGGEIFNLCLMDENIEDFKDNRTHFCLFQLKEAAEQ
ncbi:MAG: chorismate mutase [Firmicutes bacterium]|nr:chorismate mutase [Bacillota bacterium]